MAPQPLGDRIDTRGRTLRQHAARGTLVNAAFNLGYTGIGFIRQSLIAAFLTAEQFGLWGIVLLSVLALLYLKDVGIGDRFVQQDDADQELAFQKAFTINLLWSMAFFVLIVAAMPGFAAIYGRPEMIVPGWILALVVPATAFQTPLWIFYREMRFVRERALHAIEPVTALIVTLALGIAGAGAWSLIIGALAGYVLAAIAAVWFCPYPIRLRFDRSEVKSYFSFSWPLFIASGSAMILMQASVIVGEAAIGLAGVGAMGLASTIARFSERVDQIITQTMYPAICAVRDRADLLFESFTKSNRLALMWGMPVGLGVALFAPDVIIPVLGERWRFAAGLIQVFGALAAFQQLAFNWAAYYRAIGQTKPIAVNAVITMTAFVAVGIPLTLEYELTGYAIAAVFVNAVDLCVRSYYVTRLFSGFEMARHAVRAIGPSVPAVAGVLSIRLVAGDGRPLALVVAEIVLYGVVTVAATWAAERQLLREVAGYLFPARASHAA